jgi:TPR repeat protein
MALHPAISIVSLLGTMSAPRRLALFSQDSARAAPWVHALAVAGVPEAALCYGRLLLEGTGVAKDAAAALHWFRRAAAHGAADALNMVGRCLDNGWGTPENPAAAAEYYGRAAAAGHAWARYNLGHLFLDGRGVTRDVVRAYSYYRRAAEQGHERAMNLVGRCTEKGWGTLRDPAAAAEWYRRSAHAGYFRGQYNWATVLLESGLSDEAAGWFERAAAAGTPAVRRSVTALVHEIVSRGGDMSAFQRLAARLNLAARSNEASDS